MRLRSSLSKPLATAVLGAAAAMLPAAAQDAGALRVTALAATCANCHDTQGRAVEGAAVPGLAGMPAAYMVEQVKAFKSGARPATVMHQLAKGYSDAQIQQVAAYFAAQKK
jgi:cytochrome subunit of sulfide dehydrogenase